MYKWGHSTLDIRIKKVMGMYTPVTWIPEVCLYDTFEINSFILHSCY